MFDATIPPEPIASMPKAPRPGSIPQPPPEEVPVEMVPDWSAIGLFAAGIAVGAVLGASVALLLAPGSGEETRDRIADKVSMHDDDDLWDQLAEELDRAAAESEEEAVEVGAMLTEAKK